MFKRFALGVLAVSLTCLPTFADESELRSDMKNDLSAMASVFRALYAPREWKAKFAKWDLKGAVKTAYEKIDAATPITLKKYHKILTEFFNSCQDYHTSVRFLSTESARIPFHIRSAEGKFFITGIDRAKLSTTAFPFEIGDELVEFGGVPTAKAVDAIKTELGPNSPLTQQALAEYYLTTRARSIAMDVPRGSIVVAVRPKGKKEVLKREINWTYTAERVLSNSKPKLAEKDNNNLLNRKMVSPYFGIDKKVEGDENPFMLGARVSYVPELGKVIWKAEEGSAFHAYIFETLEGKKVGFVRIPHYSAGAFAAYAFSTIVKKFEEETDSMVIDQINNPGGSVFYLYALASMLSDQVLETPLHRMTIAQPDVLFAQEGLDILKEVRDDITARQAIGSSLGGYPVTYQTAMLFRDYFDFVLEEWKAGRRLTNPYHVMAVRKLNPHPQAQYTKPILVLINELDFSGGDFFPAILQDNKRATFLGTRTAGAGGYVFGFKLPNDFGIDGFSLTGSLAKRVDDQPLENLGVNPEIPYTLTANDLQNDFVDYKKAILAAIKNLK